MKRRPTITIDGSVYGHEVEPRLLLVHHVRDVAGLTGTHVGCDTRPPQGRRGMVMWLEVMLLGVVAGTVNTSTAIGWGIIALPALLLYFELAPSVAVGVTLIGYILSAVIVAMLRLSTGNIDWSLTLAISVGGAIGVLLGTLVDAHLSAAVLKKAIGVMSVLAGIAIIMSKS